MKRAKLTKEQIDGIFKEARDQSDYIIRLYRVAIPEFDQVVKLDGFPVVSRETNTYIFDKAGEFDRAYHPGVLAMGAWMNSGFSFSDSVDDWHVEMDEDLIEWKKEKEAT